MSQDDIRLCRALKITKELLPSWYRSFESNEILAEAFIIVANNSDNKSSHEQLKLATINKLKSLCKKRRLCGMVFRTQGQKGPKDTTEIERKTLEDKVCQEVDARRPAPTEVQFQDLLNYLTKDLNLIDRQIIIDTVLGGLTYREVAKKLGIGASTVSDRRRKAIKVVREVAEEMGLKAPV